MDYDLVNLPLSSAASSAAWELYNAQNEPAELTRLEQLHGFSIDQAIAAWQRDLKPRPRDSLSPDECPF